MAKRILARVFLVGPLMLMLGLTTQPVTGTFAFNPPQGPINGDYQNGGQHALVIGSTPYTSATLDTTNNNNPYINNDEPSIPLGIGDCDLVPWDPGTHPLGPNVGTEFSNPAWFEYTPTTNTSVTADTFTSNYDTAIGVFISATDTPTSAADFTEVACDNNVASQTTSAVTLQVTAGTHYFFMVVSANSDNDQSSGQWGGNLNFHLKAGHLAGFAIPQNAVEGTAMGNLPIATFVDNDADTCSDYSITVATDIQNPEIETFTCNSPPSDFSVSCVHNSDTVCTVYTTHLYAEENFDQADVQVTDSADGDSLSDATLTSIVTPIQVADAQLNTMNNGDQNAPAREGTPVSLYLGTFSDAAGVSQDGQTTFCDITDFTAKVDWGDGDNNLPNNFETITSAGAAGDNIVPSTHHPGKCNFDVYGTHTYVSTNNAAPLARTVNVQVFDVGLPFPCIATGCTPEADFFDSASVSDALANGTGVPGFNVLEGQQFTHVLGTVFDTDPLCPTEQLDVKVDWGDGSPVDTLTIPANSSPQLSYTAVGCTYTITGTHTYQEENHVPPSYTISVSGDISGGATFSFTTTATTADSALNFTTGPVGLTPLTNPTEGQAFTNVYLGTFHDAATGMAPGAAAVACQSSFNEGDFSATIDWGDGAANPNHVTTLTKANGGIVQSADGNPCDFDLLGSYTFVEEGNYTITITVKDAGGAAAIVGTDTITVDDAPLAIVSVGAPSATEGTEMPGVRLGVFHDTDPNCTTSDYSVTGNWGDGNPVIGVGTDVEIHFLGSNCDFQVDAYHVYAEEGQYNPDITVTDHVQSIHLMDPNSPNPPAVTVNDAALSVQTTTTLTTATNPTLVEGNDSGTLDLGTFSDAAGPGNCDIADYTATIDWGDGSTTTGTSGDGTISIAPGACTFQVTNHHTYAEESATKGVYSIRVTIDDLGGSEIVIPDTANVADAPLASAVNGTLVNATEGKQIVAVSLGTFTDSAPNCPTSGAALNAEYTASIAWGDGTISPASASNGTIVNTAGCTFSVIGTHTYADSRAYSPTVTVHDEGGSSTSWTFTWTVALDAVIAPIDQHLIIKGTEGAPLTNVYLGEFHDSNPNCQLSDYSAVVHWNNGSTGDPTSALNGTNGGIVDSNDGLCDFKLYGTFTYSTDGSYPISISVSDVDTATTTLTDTASIGEAALSTTALPAQYFVVEGQPDVERFLGTVHDADPNCNANDYHITIDWGDQTAADTHSGHVSPVTPGSCTFNVYGSHTFAEETINHGNQVVATIVDDATFATLTDTAWVNDAALSGAAASPTAVEGKPMINVQLGTMTDADPGCQQSDYKVTLLWSDDPIVDKTHGYLVSQGGCTYGVYATSHTFPEEGNNSVIVTVTDAGGSSVSYTVTIPTADAGLSGGQAVTITATEGASFSGIIGYIVDADPNCDINDLVVDSIDWGDGSGLDTTSGHLSATSTPCVFAVSGTHTYDEEGTYTITIHAHDTGGTAVTVTSTAQVADAALTKGPAVTITAKEGVAFTNVIVGSFADLDPDCGPLNPPSTADYTAVIDWGDNSGTSSGTISRVGNTCQFQVSGSHTYAEEGTYTISITVTDVGGSSVTLTGTAIVSDAAMNGLSNLASQTCPLLTDCGINGTMLTLVSGALQFGGSATPVAEFHDAASSCDIADYSATITWGDGTTPDTTSAVITPGSGTCNFNVYGTHTYTTIGTFTVTATIHDAGGSSVTTSLATDTSDKITVSVPASTKKMTAGRPNTLIISYGFPNQLATASFQTKLTFSQYNNGQVLGSMTHKDTSLGLTGTKAFTNCQLSTRVYPCNLQILSYRCSQTDGTAIVFAKAKAGTLIRYLRLDATGGGSYQITTQKPTNASLPVVSSPPTLPASTAVKISCTP